MAAISIFVRVCVIAGVAVLAGCAVGPNYQTPAPPDVTGYTKTKLPAATVAADDRLGQSQQFVAGLDIPGQWWTLFHSPPLNSLVERALRANPNVTAARAALREAWENVYAQQGSFWPQLSGELDASRNKTATRSLSVASASGSPYYTLYTAELSVSFVPDVFGLNRRTVESLAAQARNQRFELEATYLTLTSNVVAAAILEASLRAQIEATTETIHDETELARLLHQQYALGQVAGTDDLAQQAALAQAEQGLPPLNKQLAQQRDLLAALIGAFPSEEPDEQFDLAGFDLPLALPVSLPSALVGQRPDVRAADATLHAASAGIGIAIANRLPQFQISPFGGSDANRLSDLFGPGNGFWSLGGGLTQPLFQGGTLLHKQRAARAAYDQAAAQYRATVIAALQNVADTLKALQADAEALRAAVAADRAASESLGVVKLELRLGSVSYLALLNAEQTYFTAHIALVQAQAARLADTASLFQALGGGWWNRTDTKG
jgi:NodT family efflux transporter outer membrane factor (OMF) lipoprotein